MKSLLLLIITLGIPSSLAWFVFFLFDSNFQIYIIAWDSLLISLSNGVIALLAYNFFKKMKWENDLIYLFTRTRFKRSSQHLKRSSQHLKSYKDKMRRELNDK